MIYKIANAALWCLFGSFVVSFFLSGIARQALRQGAREVSFAITATTGILTLLSVIFGIITLCGIPRYGRKKLLWKGLVAMLVPILLALAAIPAFLKIKQIREERARQHQQQLP